MKCLKSWHQHILPRRCFFQNFNSIQSFGDFLQHDTTPSSSIFATNNSPACIFILSCTIPTKNLCKTHHKSAPGPVEWSAPIRNQATFAATPGIPKSTLDGGCRDFTLDPAHWFHGGFLWRLFFWGFPSKKGMDYSGPLPTRVLDLPKDIHIFFPKPVHFRWFPDSSLEFHWYLKF